MNEDRLPTILNEDGVLSISGTEIIACREYGVNTIVISKRGKAVHDIDYDEFVDLCFVDKGSEKTLLLHYQI